MAEMNCILKIENKEARKEFLSEEFSSLSDLLSVKLNVSKANGVVLTVLSYGKEGEKTVYSEPLEAGKCETEYTFDPISLAVYTGAECFKVKLTSDAEFTVNELLVLESADDAISDSTPMLDNTVTLENGESAVLVYPNNGEPVAVARVPKKMLFIGNSLVFGMGKKYGMCASAPDKDYFHYVTEHVKKYNPVCVFDKMYGSMFEHSESLSAFDDWFYRDVQLSVDAPISAESYFTEDIDLILLQLGDNVNTDEKESNFKITGDILIERIKERCPRARIIWLHGWYNRKRTDAPIKAICDKWKLERIDIGAVRSPSAEAHTQKYYYDVNAGEMREVSERWITHPGDIGMKKIADKIIEKLKLV